MDYKKLYEEQMIQNKKLNDECDKYEGVIALTTDLLTQEIEQLKHKVSICEAEQEEEANLYIKVKEENEKLKKRIEEDHKAVPSFLIKDLYLDAARENKTLKEEHESLKKDFECYKGKYFLAPECHDCDVLLTEDDLFASLDCVACVKDSIFCCEGCREEYEDSDED